MRQATAAVVVVVLSTASKILLIINNFARFMFFSKNLALVLSSY